MCLSCWKNREAASVAGAEWAELRTKREQGTRSWKAPWSTEARGYTQVCLFTLPEPDRGQSLFPIRVPGPTLTLKHMAKHKKIESVLGQTVPWGQPAFLCPFRTRSVP